jgi:hypothetical protein
VVGYYEHDNEPSGSIKGREFLDWLSDIGFSSQARLCSMEFINETCELSFHPFPPLNKLLFW